MTIMIVVNQIIKQHHKNKAGCSAAAAVRGALHSPGFVLRRWPPESRWTCENQRTNQRDDPKYKCGLSAALHFLVLPWASIPLF